ncbi:nuclear transport factor 2 family protein [Vogesella facilis]|uniref:Nuclear transport factor 2 family protein n=1 Tax=Vogesella facilis TaxID=1655232 RepID=A0ABV7RCU6_9NEIS
MDRNRFEQYIARFNAEDASAFDDFLAPEVTVQNGRLHYCGVQGMKDHYAKIWGKMKETLSVRRFVCDGSTLAVWLETHFAVQQDDAASLFGSVRAGESFDYSGLVMYQLDAAGKFADIKVAYFDFVRTDLNGVRHSLGIVH